MLKNVTDIIAASQNYRTPPTHGRVEHSLSNAKVRQITDELGLALEPGTLELNTTELHEPMDELDVCPNLI
jgi:hypothetical protein